MHRIDTFGAAPGNLFTDGDPLLAIPPTRMGEKWHNAVQEELCGFIESMGGTLDDGDNSQLTTSILRAAAMGALGNALINGDFRFWQRNGPSSGNNPTNHVLGFHGPDRWLLRSGQSGESGSLSRVIIDPALLPSGVESVLRWNKTTAAGPGAEVSITQRVEKVTSFAGQKVVLAFDALKFSGSNLTLLGAELVQNFGSGGSPSADVTTAMVAQAGLLIDGSARRLVFSATVPSITGKTVGTGNDRGYLAVRLKATVAVTFDVYLTAMVLSRGTRDPGYFPRPYGQELELCRRYYQKGHARADGSASSGAFGFLWDTAYNGGGDVHTARRGITPTYLGSGVNTTTWVSSDGTLGSIHEDSPTPGNHPVTTAGFPTDEGVVGSPRITTPPAGGTLRAFRAGFIVNTEIGTET